MQLDTLEKITDTVTLTIVQLISDCRSQCEIAYTYDVTFTSEDPDKSAPTQYNYKTQLISTVTTCLNCISDKFSYH